MGTAAERSAPRTVPALRAKAAGKAAACSKLRPAGLSASLSSRATYSANEPARSANDSGCWSVEHHVVRSAVAQIDQSGVGIGYFARSLQVKSVPPAGFEPAPPL